MTAFESIRQGLVEAIDFAKGTPGNAVRRGLRDAVLTDFADEAGGGYVAPTSTPSSRA